MKELIEKYPKAAKIVNDFYLAKLLEGMNDKSLPEEFVAHVKQQGLPEEQIVKLLEVNPGALMEVFDENEIYIDIDVHILSKETKDDVYFSFNIPNAGIERDSFESRKNAEKDAIIKAFEILEKKLTE